MEPSTCISITIHSLPILSACPNKRITSPEPPHKTYESNERVVALFRELSTKVTDVQIQTLPPLVK